MQLKELSLPYLFVGLTDDCEVYKHCVTPHIIDKLRSNQSLHFFNIVDLHSIVGYVFDNLNDVSRNGSIDQYLTRNIEGWSPPQSLSI